MMGKWMGVLALALLLNLSAQAGTRSEGVAMHAAGQFEVKLTPQAAAPAIEAAKLGRMLIDKQFQGDLNAHSLGEMLAFRTDAPGSAGYVAMERVDGVLGGKKGSFVLQHSGTMHRGASSLSLTVVPDSGTGELAGLAGAMTIDIREGKHFYSFDYRLP